MSDRDDDLRMLSEMLDNHLDEMTEKEVLAFADMRFDLQAYGGMEIPSAPMFRQLTEKQRAWVKSVHARVVPYYANLVSRGLVPRGKEVPTPAVLQNLPKRPPPWRRDDE